MITRKVLCSLLVCLLLYGPAMCAMDIPPEIPKLSIFSRLSSLLPTLDRRTILRVVFNLILLRLRRNQQVSGGPEFHYHHHDHKHYHHIHGADQTFSGIDFSQYEKLINEMSEAVT